MTDTKLNARLNELVAALNALEESTHAANGCDNFPADKVRWSERTKFCAIDIGTSGAWLVEKSTGELFNIKAYGVPDRNKKAKADIGNVFTCKPEELYRRRYNYLR